MHVEDVSSDQRAKRAFLGENQDGNSKEREQLSNFLVTPTSTTQNIA